MLTIDNVKKVIPNWSLRSSTVKKWISESNASGILVDCDPTMLEQVANTAYDKGFNSTDEFIGFYLEFTADIPKEIIPDDSHQDNSMTRTSSSAKTNHHNSRNTSDSLLHLNQPTSSSSSFDKITITLQDPFSTSNSPIKVTLNKSHSLESAINRCKKFLEFDEDDTVFLHAWNASTYQFVPVSDIRSLENGDNCSLRKLTSREQHIFEIAKVESSIIYNNKAAIQSSNQLVHVIDDDSFETISVDLMKDDIKITTVTVYSWTSIDTLTKRCLDDLNLYLVDEADLEYQISDDPQWKLLQSIQDLQDHCQIRVIIKHSTTLEDNWKT
jgi:hypothetical protein